MPRRPLTLMINSLILKILGKCKPSLRSNVRGDEIESPQAFVTSGERDQNSQLNEHSPPKVC